MVLIYKLAKFQIFKYIFVEDIYFFNFPGGYLCFVVFDPYTMYIIRYTF